MRIKWGVVVGLVAFGAMWVAVARDMDVRYVLAFGFTACVAMLVDVLID